MKPISSICVFCASSQAVDQVYRDTAADLGRRMGKGGIELIYGGASIGLMGAVARGVHEKGGKVVGILPEFFCEKEIEYGDADELVVTKDMRERKGIMDERSDAFIVLPGGVGTLEEAMEIMSLIQLKLTKKPLVFVNTLGFYDDLIDLLKKMVDLKFAKGETLNMFAVVPDPEAALQHIKEYKSPHLHSKWI